jgi:hypothetical protein
MGTMKASLIVAVLALVTPMRAAVVDGVNWADEVAAHAASMQNYDGLVMNEGTAWWLLGAPDCDVNENGYAWDAGDRDTVAGWRTTDADAYVVLYWEAGLPDRSGDDLRIVLYGGPLAEAEVSASVDGVAYEVVGTLGGGTPGYLREETFDFAGLFETCVHYVRATRVTSGPQTGMFFDAFGGRVYWGDLDGDCDVDLHDVAVLQVCGAGGGVPGPACAAGDLDGDDDVDGADGVLLAEEVTGPGVAGS